MEKTNFPHRRNIHGRQLLRGSSADFGNREVEDKTEDVADARPGSRGDGES